MLVCRINRAVYNPQWELFDSMRAKCFHRLDVGIAVKLGTKIIDGWERYMVIPGVGQVHRKTP